VYSIKQTSKGTWFDEWLIERDLIDISVWWKSDFDDSCLNGTIWFN